LWTRYIYQFDLYLTIIYLDILFLNLKKTIKLNVGKMIFYWILLTN